MPLREIARMSGLKGPVLKLSPSALGASTMRMIGGLYCIGRKISSSNGSMRSNNGANRPIARAPLQCDLDDDGGYLRVLECLPVEQDGDDDLDVRLTGIAYPRRSVHHEGMQTHVVDHALAQLDKVVEEYLRILEGFPQR